MAEPVAAPAPEGPKRPQIIDAIADLLQMASDWLRQEVETTVREKVALPMQRAGSAVAAVLAAAGAFVMGLVFVAVALFMFLGQAVGYAMAFLIVGLVYLIAAGIFLAVKARVMLK